MSAAAGFAGHLTLRCRAVEPADTAAVQALIGGIYQAYGFDLDLEGEERHLNAPGPAFEAWGGAFWVVEGPGGAIVGTVAARPGPTPQSAELKAMYVDPAWRRRGLGAALEGVVASWARQRGAARLILWSDTRFDAAHAMYRRLGYTQEGQRALHDPYDSVEYGFWRALEPASSGDQPASFAAVSATRLPR